MTTNDPCSRQLLFAGKVRTFNLNDRAVVSVITGDILGARDNMPLFMHFGGALPLDGQHGSTPAACLKRFLQSEYSISDIENVIILGLVGGGMAAADAIDLARQHVTGQPLAANALIASEVISALFVGASNEAA